MLISMLKKYTNGRDLVRLGMTRFATAYLNLSCLREMKAFLMRLFSSVASIILLAFSIWRKVLCLILHDLRHKCGSN